MDSNEIFWTPIIQQNTLNIIASEPIPRYKTNVYIIRQLHLFFKKIGGNFIKHEVLSQSRGFSEACADLAVCLY